MLTKYAVGEPYPHPLPAGEGLIIQTMPGGTIDIVAKLIQPSSREVTTFRQGTFRWGVFVEDAIPVVVVQFPDEKLELDGPYNFHKVVASSRAEWLQGAANAVTLFLVDEKNIIRTMRLIGAEPAMMQVLRDAAAEQLTRYETATDVDYAINILQSKRSLSAMLKAATLHLVKRS
jgi:hypothetical protein